MFGVALAFRTIASASNGASHVRAVCTGRGMDLAYQALAAKYIRRQTKQLAEQMDGVRAATDIEAVHRARVASRRLRAAFRVFADAFPARKIERWRKAVRRITSALGAARDRDVQIDLLCAKLSELRSAECFPGLARILVDLERERERFQRQVIKAVDRLERSTVFREMREAAKKVIQEAAQNASATPCGASLQHVEGHVTKHLDELLSLQDCLADAAATEQHHAMRIAAKRLRYTLELSRPLCPKRLDPAVSALKRLQTLLGDVHDCDVWVEHLQAFADSEKDRLTELFGHPGRFLHLQAGIEYLENDRAAQRQATFGELVQYWSELQQQDFFGQLRSIFYGKRPTESPNEMPLESVSDASAVTGQGGEPSETPASQGPSEDSTPIASDDLADDRPPERKPILTTGF